MKYKIYTMVKPEHLQKTVPDGYYMRDVVRCVLEEVDEFYHEYDSIEDAMMGIRENAINLKHHELTILPVININFNGEVDG